MDDAFRINHKVFKVCYSKSNNKCKNGQYQFKCHLSNINLMEMTVRYDTFYKGISVIGY
jgi:hypothetical protein